MSLYIPCQSLSCFLLSGELLLNLFTSTILSHIQFFMAFTSWTISTVYLRLGSPSSSLPWWTTGQSLWRCWGRVAHDYLIRIYSQAHVIVTGTSWTRIYFVIFYLLTIVVLTLVVAAILEAFLFRIQYKKQLKKEDGNCLPLSTYSLNDLLTETDQLGISVTVSSTELSYLSNTLVSRMMSMMKYSLPRLVPGSDGVILFRGDKRQGEDIFYQFTSNIWYQEIQRGNATSPPAGVTWWGRYRPGSSTRSVSLKLN